MESHMDEWHRSRNPVIVAVVGDHPRLPDDPRDPAAGDEQTAAVVEASSGQDGGEQNAGEQQSASNSTGDGDASGTAGDTSGDTTGDDAAGKAVDASNVETKVVTSKPAGTPRKTQADTK